MYTAKHQILASGKLIGRGDVVTGLPDKEYARLIKLGAIVETTAPAPAKASKTSAKPEGPYAGKSEEDLKAMFKKYTIAQLTKVAEDNGLDIPEDVTKAFFIESFVECGIVL